MKAERAPIRGIVIDRSNDHRGTELKTDLIVQATASEVAAITLGDTVALAKQDGLAAQIEQDMLLYDSQGRPVAMITEMVVTREKIDVTSRRDTRRRFMPGPPSISIRAVGVLPLALLPGV